MILEGIKVFNVVESSAAREGTRLIVGLVTVVAAGWGLVVLISRFVAPGTRLTVDHEGFDHVFGVGKVRWDDVVGWEVVSIGQAAAIAVDLRDDGSFVESRSAAEREAVESNVRVSGRPLVIVVEMIGGGTNAVLAAFERFSPHGAAGRSA